MSKRNIAYIKPQDPSFLAKLKAEIGYKEGPTVDTKRQKLSEDVVDSDSGAEDSERPVREDEQPQVVVVKTGDLTKEQAEQEQRRIAQEEAEAPADLKRRVIFKKKIKSQNTNNVESKSSTSKKSKKKVKKSNTIILSFSDNDEDDYNQ